MNLFLEWLVNTTNSNVSMITIIHVYVITCLDGNCSAPLQHADNIQVYTSSSLWCKCTWHHKSLSCLYCLFEFYRIWGERMHTSVSFTSREIVTWSVLATTSSSGQCQDMRMTFVLITLNRGFEMIHPSLLSPWILDLNT